MSYQVYEQVLKQKIGLKNNNHLIYYCDQKMHGLLKEKTAKKLSLK